MYKLVLLPLFFAAVSAGYLGAAPAVASYAAAPALVAAPAVASYAAAPAVASYAAAPAVVAAPAVAHAAVPVATSYANTYRAPSLRAAPLAYAAGPAYIH